MDDGVVMQYWPTSGSALDLAMQANANGPGDVNHIAGILNPDPLRDLNWITSPRNGTFSPSK